MLRSGPCPAQVRFGLLRVLNLKETAIANDDLAAVVPLCDLELLDVTGTLVTNVGLEEFLEHSAAIQRIANCRAQHPKKPSKGGECCRNASTESECQDLELYYGNAEAGAKKRLEAVKAGVTVSLHAAPSPRSAKGLGQRRAQ